MKNCLFAIGLLICFTYNDLYAQGSNQLPTITNRFAALPQFSGMARVNLYRNQLSLYSELVATRRKSTQPNQAKLDLDWRLGLLYDFSTDLSAGLDVQSISLLKFLPYPGNDQTTFGSGYLQYHKSSGSTSRSLTGGLGYGFIPNSGGDGYLTGQLSGSFLVHVYQREQQPIVSLGMAGFITRMARTDREIRQTETALNYLELRPMVLVHLRPSIQLSVSYRVTQHSRYTELNGQKQRSNMIQPIVQFGAQVQIGSGLLPLWQRANNYQGMQYF